MNARDWLDMELVDEYMVANGLDDAIIGYVERYGQPILVLYDRKRCIELFMHDGMTDEEAIEHFEYNVIGAWTGECTPAFATLFKGEESE